MRTSYRILTLFLLPLHLLSQELELDLPSDGFETGMDLAPLVKEETLTPQHPGPGLTKKIECFHHRDTVYDLYLPSAYAEQPEEKFPLLLVQNPSGRPKIQTYQSWAEERGVILVGLYKVSNGMKQHDKPRHWGAFLKDLEAKNVRVQKGLVMTVGMSGGSADGERFTRHFPDHTCGVIIMGVTLVPKGDQRKHIAAGLIIGGKDPFQGVAGREKLWNTIQKDGIAVRPVFDIGRRHDTAPLSETLMLLDWMLDLGRLQSPQLSEETRADTRKRMLERIPQLIREETGAERKERMEHFLTLPPLTGTEEHLALQEAWLQNLVRESNAIQDAVDAGLHLLDELARAERTQVLPADQMHGLVQKHGRDLPDGLLTSWKALRDIEHMEWEAHLDKTALAEVDRAYETFQQQDPFPALQERAAAARTRLKRFL